MQSTLSALLLIIAAAIPAWLALYTWRRRSASGAKPFVVLMLALCVWGACYALELLVGADMAAKVFWRGAKYLGVVVTPLASLAFALEYTGRQAWLTRRKLALFSIEPLLTILLIATNTAHYLVWLPERLVAEGPFVMLNAPFGVWFWIHAAYSYALLLVSAILVVQALVRRPPLFRGQMIGLMLGLAAPWLGNVITISGLSPIPDLDLTSFAFTITGLSLTWGIFRFYLLDLAPIARELVAESMRDGMIVFDARGRIADLNPAAQQMVGATASQLIGRPAAEVFEMRPDLVQRYQDASEARDEIVVGEDAARRNLELQLSPLRNRRGSIIGRVVTLHDITEHKRAAAQLQDSEARYRQLVENADDIIYHTDAEGRFTYVNPIALRIMGFADEADLSGKHYLELVRPDSRHRLKRFYDHQFLAREPNTYQEFPAVTADGRTVWIGQNVQLLADGDRVIGFQAIARDINERRRAEEALAQQTAQLSVLYQLSQEMVATLDLEQVYDIARCAVEQLMPTQAFFISLYDEKQQEIQDAYLFDRGRRWPNQNDPLSVRGITARVIHTGEPLWIEDDMDGTSLAMGRVLFGEMEDTRSVMIVPLKLGKKIIGVISAQHYAPNVYTPDHLKILVTLANQVAIAIERARQVQSLRLQATALDTAANAIVIADRDGIIQWVNPAFTSLTGYTADEAIDQKLHLIKSGRHDEAFYQSLWATVLAGEIWRGELINRRKDGSLYFEEQTITPVQDEHGEIFRFVAIKQDITKRKQAEEVLALARDQALEASRLKSHLLATVSHELRTPLGAILGYAELLRDGSYGPLVDRQKEIVAEVIDSTLHLTRLVNELLDEAQLEAGAVKLRIDSFAPGELLHKVESNMALMALNKGLAFTTSIAPDLPPVLAGDDSRLYQILINLVGNAIKFTPSGAVRVRLYCPDAERWAMEVSDSGPGIPPEARQYIFEPFQQLDSSMTREHRGTGLGLSIAKHLAELMGGSIALDSEVGRGSVFTVRLPLVRVAEVAA